MLRLVLAAAFFCALTVPGPARAWTRDRVLLVIDNRSSNARAAGEVTPLVKDLLQRKGYEVIGAEPQALPVDRSGGAHGPAVREAIEKAQADAAVTISIGFLLDARARPRGPGASPAIGMLARMYSPQARVTWRNSLAMILDEPASRPASRTSFVTRSRGQAGGAEPALKSPTAIVCEQLLWTLPRGRPSPEEIAARTAPPPPAAEQVKATRFEAEPERARVIGDAARFPLRNDRTVRERDHDRSPPKP